MGTRLRTENEDSMQREKVMEIILMVKPEVKEKNMLQLLNTGPGEKENQIWANSESSPLSMSYDQEKGWTAEVWGPKSGHWKFLAKQAKTKSLQVEPDPTNQKRKGDTSLSELDPNVNRKRRSKGKFQAEKSHEENGKRLAVWRWLQSSPAQPNECPCLELPGFRGFASRSHPYRSGEKNKLHCGLSSGNKR